MVHIGIVIGVAGIIIGLISGWVLYRRAKKENEKENEKHRELIRKNTETITSWVSANIRIQEDESRSGAKRGSLKITDEGIIYVHWNLEVGA